MKTFWLFMFPLAALLAVAWVGIPTSVYGQEAAKEEAVVEAGGPKVKLHHNKAAELAPDYWRAGENQNQLD